MMRRALPHVLAWGAYLLAAVLLTWPLAGQLSTHLAGFEYGDSREMARHIWWYAEALRTGQNPIFQPNMAYPDGLPGGVLLWANPQQFFPAWLLALVLPLPVAANLAVLLYMALNGWAAYFLGRYLLGGRHAPAFITGLVFMAAPTFQAHLAGGHAGLMVAWPLPLYIWALLKLIERPRWRYFALAVIFFVLSPGGHLLQVIYMVLPVTAALLLWRVWLRDWRGAGRVLAVNAVGAGVLALYLLPIAGEIFGTPAYIDEGGFTRYSIDLLSVVSPSFYHPLYGGLDYPRRVLGINLEEGSSYIGLIAGGLALAGIVRGRAARPWLLLALIGWGLALGPLLKVFDQPVSIYPDNYETYITLPWALLQNLPGISLARTPGRFNFALALAVALLAGYGARALLDALPVRARWAIVLALAALILFDYRFFWPFPTHSAAIPGAVRTLAARDDIRAVFDVPWANTVAAKAGLYLQTGHQQALIAGHVTRSTPVDPARLSILQDTLDPALLRQAGADVVIIHRTHVSPEQQAQAAAQLGAPLYEDSQLAVYEVPDATQAPGVIYSPPFTGEISGRQALYVYVPAAGWLDVTGSLAANGRAAVLLHNNEPVQRWQVDDTQDFRLPLRLSAGYHTLTFTVEPPCPTHYGAALRCRALTAEVITEGFTPLADDAQTVAFANGITLDYALNEDGLRLLWRFENPPPPDAIRFVHVVDAEGDIARQFDNPLDTHGLTAWAEALPIAEGLPAGEYRVYVGWYDYPGLNRYPVLTPVEGAADGRVLVGTLRR